MVIKYSSKKNSLKIFSESKVISSHFKQWFLTKLTESFDLYEYLNENIRLLDEKKIYESTIFNDLEIAEWKQFYQFNKIYKHLNFEEFLDSMKVGFADTYIYPKGTSEYQIDLQHDKRMLASIDFAPDGDMDYIWIANVTPEMNLLMKNLVDEYNANRH